MTSTTNNVRLGLDLSEPSPAGERADSLVHSFDQLSIKMPGLMHEEDEEEEQILWPRSPMTGTPPTGIDQDAIPEHELYDPHAIHGQVGFELVRGDYGSKVYTPRTRGTHGHRSTKSESAVSYSLAPTPNVLSPPTATPAAVTRGSAAERWDYAFSHGPGKGGARTPKGGERGAAGTNEKEKDRDRRKKWSEEMESVDVDTVSIPTQASKAAATPVRPRSTPGEIVPASRAIPRLVEVEKTNKANTNNDEKKRGRTKKGAKAVKQPGQDSGLGVSAANGSGAGGSATSETPVQAHSQKSKTKTKAAARSKSSRSRSPASPSSDSSVSVPAPTPPAAAPASAGKRKRSGSSAKRFGAGHGREKEQKERAKEARQQGKSRLKAKPARLEHKDEKQVNEVEEDVIVPSPAPSTPRGLGHRSVVDDLSENGDVPSLEMTKVEKDRLLTTAYDEAVKFMNSFIQHPYYYTSKASRLTFLQALIVELGLVSVHDPELALPSTLTSARAMIKSHAFLNVRDYLAVRAQGLDALRHAMHPNRKALVRDLRRGKEKRRAPVQWVKETGLTVLLVHCRS